MKIHCISDTHTRHREIELPGGDVLIHAGDIMSKPDPSQLTEFLVWFTEQNYTTKIFISGNHDHIFEKSPTLIKKILKMFPSLIYLQDSDVTIDGIKFYGAPWVPTNRPGKAFSYLRDALGIAKSHWSKIPNDTDVLITHGPAYNKLDKIMKPIRADQPQLNLGCPQLAERIKAINPQLHICGHIHSSQGILDISESTTTYINAASLGEDYQYSNKRRFIEWEILKTTSEIGLQRNGIALTIGKQEQVN
jgi:Icc-related predicted phosphoesterase